MRRRALNRDPAAAPPSRKRAAAVPALILGIFAALVFLLASRHEPWRDEADSWLLVRDAGPLEILHRLAYKGTPGLWYAVLLPLAKAGFPIEAMQAVHAVLAVAAGALLLFRAPFPLVLRALFLFGYYLSYEYAVVARSYVLDVVLLFALASFRDPARRPFAFGAAIAVLANANVHGFLLAGVLFVVLFDRMPLTTRATAAAGLVAALWQLWPPADGQFTPAVIGFRWRLALDAISRAFFPLDVEPVRVAAAVLLAAFAAWFLAKRLRALLLLAGGWLVLLALFTVVRGGSARYDGLLWLWLIFVAWLTDRSDSPPEERTRRLFHAVLGISAVVSCLAAARIWSLEWRLPFSEAREMARELDRRGLAAAPIAAHPAPLAESVLANLPARRFWYPGIGEEGSFMKWDAAYLKGLDLMVDEAAARVRRSKPYGAPPLFLACEPLEKPGREGYRLAYATAGRAFAKPDERYYLYVPVDAARRSP